MKRILAIVLSLCLLLCFPVAVSAEDEDLLSHYNGDDIAYLRFLLDYFDEKYWGSSDAAVYYTGFEMAKMVNTFHNDLQSHPYLRGTIDPETGEITITGMQVVAFKYDDAQSLLYNPELYEKFNHYFYCKPLTEELVIPDEIDGHPVTRIADGAFYRDRYNEDRVESFYSDIFRPTSIVIGDNVREIGSYAFQELFLTQEVTFGKNVEVIGTCAFERCGEYSSSFEIKSWGESLTTIEESAFSETRPQSFPPLPDTLAYIGYKAFAFMGFDRFTIPQSVKTLFANFLWFSSAYSLIVLSKDLEIDETEPYPTPEIDNFDGVQVMYCYSGSTFEQFAKQHDYAYTLIDGDSLLWDGEAVEGNVLHKGEGMTEAELREHLGVDGTSSEIQIDGLQDGKAVQGTTITLFHTIAQAPGKVYAVEKVPVPVRAQIETMPTKTNYIYKEPFNPSGLSLRVTYDNGNEAVVTDGITCTNTDLHIGANTITATYENVSTTFDVTVRTSQPVSTVVETMPTKTSYIYKETFDPTGLSLRVTYDNGDEAVVTDGITFTNTDLQIGTNTITATYENVSTTFPVTVRYTWWQTLIRIFLFGFLWY